MSFEPPSRPEPPSRAASSPVVQGGWTPFLAALSSRSVGVAIGFGITGALVLNPIFGVPFPVLLGRTLFLAMLLLLAYAAARQWRPRWLPERFAPIVWPMVMVGLAAPLGTLAIYLLSVGGDIAAFVRTPARVSGFAWISGSAVVVGLLLAASAGVRERLAEARSRELQLELERSRLERQALDARLSLLQAQIEPHFLFNTLANVQALVEAGSPRAAGVLRSLIAYLRAAMPRLHDEKPSLGNELALVRAYLELMQMRMPDRLRFRIDADAALGTRRFPPMALLTLVENAIRHGIDPLEDGGEIVVSAALHGEGWRVAVTDTGSGLDPHSKPGVGLANLRERLAGFFGGAAELQLEEVQPHGVRAEISMPAADPAPEAQPAPARQ